MYVPASFASSFGSLKEAFAQTRTFHGGCSAEDPTGASGNGVDNLLRAIYILGMSPARLQTAEMLEARRVAYEL